MSGLLLLAAAVTWLIVCTCVALFLSKRISSTWGKVVFVPLVTAALLIGPFISQIVGKYQFDSYCKAAQNVTFIRTIPAPKELYSPTGEWRLAKFSAQQFDENTRLVRLADSLVRWDTGNYVGVSNFTNVGVRQTKLYERSSNRLVAEWTSYSYRGGLGGLMGSTDECHPTLMRQEGYGIYRQVFAFQS